MHAIHNEQLREVMNGLRGVSFNRLPQELDDPGRQQAYFQEASSRAQELAQAAERIGGIVGQTGLTPDEQRVFLGLADVLRDRALLLQTRAERRQTRLINDAMKEINDTCAACHTLFRDMPQPSKVGAP